MPADARTSRNAAKCSGSLLASTPSKSKTIARSATRSSGGRTPHAFAGADGNFQPIFPRRDWTFVAGVVVAIRKVRAVEIELVDTLRIAIEIQVAAAGVRLRAAGHVVEHHGEMLRRSRQVVERRDRQGLPFQRKLERAGLSHLPRCTGRCRHVDDRGIVARCQRRWHVVRRIDREVRERQQFTFLDLGNRIVLLRKQLIFLRTLGGNSLRVVARVHRRLAAAGGKRHQKQGDPFRVAASLKRQKMYPSRATASSASRRRNVTVSNGTNLASRLSPASIVRNVSPAVMTASACRAAVSMRAAASLRNVRAASACSDARAEPPAAIARSNALSAL